MEPRDLIETEFARSLIGRVARRMDRKDLTSEFTVEDWEQELSLGLIRGSPRFDPALGSAEAFITWVVSLCAAMLERRFTSKKRQFERSWSDLTEVVPAHSVRDPDLAIDLAAALDSLPPDLRELAEALMEVSLTAHARRTGVARSTWQRRGSKIRDRFEDKGLSDYL